MGVGQAVYDSACGKKVCPLCRGKVRDFTPGMTSREWIEATASGLIRRPWLCERCQASFAWEALFPQPGAGR